MDQIQVDLFPCKDRNGKRYYIANPNLEIEIDLSKMVFFVFVAEDGDESLVIRTRQSQEELKSHNEKL